MSQPSEPEDTPSRYDVAIIDTSALIRLKKIVKVGDQWQLLRQMEDMVNAGSLAFPRQVTNEMKRAQFPDGPGIWAAGCNGQRHFKQPKEESVRAVLEKAQLIDISAEDDGDVADPYIAAMAMEAANATRPGGALVPLVVTDDFVDRMPAKESLATACDRLLVAWCRPNKFLTHLKDGLIGP